LRERRFASPVGRFCLEEFMRCLVTRVVPHFAAAAVSAAAFISAAALGGCNFAHGGALVYGGGEDAAAGGGGAGGAAGAGGAGGGLAGKGGGSGTGWVAGGSGTATDGGDGPPSGSSSPDSNCGEMSQEAKMVPPDILIVQDKSGSMNQDASGAACTMAGCSKWSQTTTALNTVVAATENVVNWGLKFFATGNACDVAAGAEVAVGPMNATAIATAITGATPGSSTPTRAAMQAAVAYLQTLTDTNPKYILLATDGLPNCAANGGTMGNDATAAEQAVADALTAGFPTFVVGIGNTMGNTVLNVMAMNGGKPQMVPPASTYFYQVNNTTDLVTALNAIIGSVASCTFNLGMAPNGFSSNKAIDVFGDGNKIPQDPTMTDGWSYVGGGTDQIQIFGPTCDMIMSGAIQKVAVTYRCVVN
jgi:hypothetical protein